MSIHSYRLVKEIKPGTRFGMLVVLRRNGSAPKSGNAVWLCKCDCGKEKSIVGSSLRAGQQSCGCLRGESHGQCKRERQHPLYQTWAGIKKRCMNPRCKAYKNYGGRGIKICDRWRVSFLTFLEDVGERPTPQHTLDRFPDNNGDYKPGNVRWTTRREQNRNQRKNLWLTLNSKTQILADWAREQSVIDLGISEKLLQRRIRLGWPVQRALTEAVHNNNGKGRRE